MSQLVFAIHNISQASREALLETCRLTGARVVVMPDVLSVIWRLAAEHKVDGDSAEGNGRHAPASSARLPITPPVRIGDAAGFYVETELVAAWLTDLARLMVEGRPTTVEQRIREIQRSLGHVPLPRPVARAPAPAETGRNVSAVL